MERSSRGEREDAKMERSTAGVTGILRCWSADGSGARCLVGLAVDVVDADEEGMVG